MSSTLSHRRSSVLVIQDVSDPTRSALLNDHPTLRVLRADSVEDALNIIYHNALDLTLIDQRIGASSAAEVCEQIRACDDVGDVPILLLCEPGSDASMAGFAAGADGLIPTPVNWPLANAQIDALLKLNRFGNRRRLSDELERAEHQLAVLKECDGATGLPNATMFESSVVQEIDRARRADYALGVLVVEFSNYDTLGSVCDQATLDRLTRAMADRLSSAVRGRAVVARLDARCLAICQPLPRTEEVTRAVHKYRRSLADSYEIDGQAFEIDCSIGASVFPTDADDAERLVGLASSAMAHARSMGRNRYHLFAPAARADAKRRLQLESQIRSAIERDGMLLHYQPRLRLSDGAVTGVEALLRLRGEDGELLSPYVFLPIAEDSGMMEQLGLWAIRRACSDLNEMRAAGVNVRMAVNVAGDLFSKDTFFSELCEAFEEHDMSGEDFELEVSERAVQSKLHGSLENLQSLIERLHDRGVHVSLDNFGAGQSCLTELRHLPLDNIKLAHDLIAGVPDDERMTRVVQSMVALGASLGVRVIAQGVETEEQMSALRDMGADEAQGYLFARPMPLAQLTPMLQSMIAAWSDAHGRRNVATA
ncbi:MAG: putative bifunctional diguanylate cyclase/phosphodiesterase [Gammaproteobacteria bacterium]